MGSYDNTIVGSDSEYENIQIIKDKLANTILICIAFLGAPLIFISFLRFLEAGGKLLLATHFIIYLFCISAALFRKKIPMKPKALFVIGCAFLMAATSIVKWGIIGSGVAYFVFCSILVSIFYGIKPGLAITILNLIIMVIAAILFNTGYLHYNFDIDKFSIALPTWISTTSVYGCYTVVLVVCLSRLYISMSNSIEKLASRTSELNIAKEQMEKEIKNRKEAEEALQDSEEQFRVVLENLPVGVFVHDLDGNNMIVNDEACRSTGYLREELLTKTVEDTEAENFNPDEAKKTWAQLVESGESMTFESTSHRKDGFTYDTEVHLKSVMLQGRPVILVIVFNISDRKKAETALRESEERFKTVLENLPCAVSVHDLDGRHLIVNEETCRVKGYTREELLKLTVMDTAGPAMGTTFNPMELWGKIEPGASFIFDTLTERKDGSLYDSEVHLSKIMLEGQPVILSLVFDITERKKSEEALKKSEMYLRTLISTIPDFVWLKDKDGKFLFCNPRFALFGGSEEDIIGKTDYDFLPEKVADSVREKDQKVITNGQITKNEELILYDDGHQEFLETIRTPMYSSDGELVGVLSIGRDITERKKMEDNLARRSELERMISEISSKIVGMNQDEVEAYIDEALAIIGQKTGVDHAYLFLFQPDKELIKNINEWCADDMVSHIGDLKNIQPEEEVPWFTEKLKSQQVVHIPDIEKLPSEADKDKLYFQKQRIKSLIVMVMRQGENLLGFLGFDNIHEKRTWSEDEIIILRILGEALTSAIQRKFAENKLRESEEKLARANKMESLGLLAGSVAHDLNNVLSGIVSYPELLLLDLPEGSKLRKPIETIQESGNKAVAIVQDLLTIARGAAIIKEPINLNDVILEYMASPEFFTLKKNHPAVEFKLELSDDLFRISGSPIHIKKMIMNLVSNASEAIETHGNVTVSTKNRYVDMPLSKYEDVKIGEYVVLTILDDGPGIAPENLDRIFEPFFTKKMMGISGTGLGLTVVWNTVQDHSGYIDITSNKGGTKFELYFPITREESVRKESSVSLGELKGNGELILVVDDVKNQREISCQMLDSLGYKYIAVPSGEKAIEYLKVNKVDLVLLDMIMTPGISGRRTYEQIVKIHPGQKAVIISGYSETEDVVATQKLGAGKYIRKPFSLESLGWGIKEELNKS